MKRRTRALIELITKRWWMFVAIAAAATFVFTLFMGLGQDIWFDENYSIILAKQPIPELLRLTGVDAHPPLFYLLLKAWGSVFGWSELALRSMSALLAAGTVAVTAVLIRRLFTPRVALVTLPILIMAPFWLRYGYEVRMYALAGFIAALATLALYQAVKTKTSKKLWGLYALLVAFGMYTLYMTAVVWLAHAVWLLINQRKNFWKQPWVRAYGAAVIVFLAYLPTAIFQFTHSALPGIGQVLNLTHIGETLSQVIIYTPEWSVNALTAFGLLVMVGLTIFLLDRSHRFMPPSTNKALGLLLCLAFVPFAFFVIISLPMSQPFFVTRYLAHVVIFVYALIGVAAALGWRYGYRVPAVILYVVTLILLGWGDGQLVQAGNFNFERMQRPHTTDVRQIIDCKNSVVIADDAYTYINDQYYFEDCDFRFYSTTQVRYEGGYAWLANNGTRVAKSSDLTATRIVHLYWNDSPKTFYPDERYKLVSSTRFDQQMTDTYELSAE